MAETTAPGVKIVEGAEEPHPCTTCNGKKKKKKMSPAVQKMIAGLPPDQQALVEKSPSLQAKLEKLNGDGWHVDSVTSAGASASRGDQVIKIGSGYNDVGTFSHEVGHASYDPPPSPSPNGMTEQQYVDASVSRDFRDEGAAQFSRAETRADILSNGGPDIGFGGTRTQQYGQIWDQYSAGNINADQAATQMGQQFGNETTSTTGQSYGDYYGSAARSNYQLLTGPGAK